MSAHPDTQPGIVCAKPRCCYIHRKDKAYLCATCHAWHRIEPSHRCGAEQLVGHHLGQLRLELSPC